MGCLQTKPKLRPQTVVVHSCDYHSDGMNGVVKILKSPSPSARYASTDVISEIAESSDQPRFVRRKPNATPSKTPPSSPHITLPSTPDEEKSTLHVLDAEDLEPANYIPTSEEVAETKTALSEINSHVSVSEVTFNPAGSIGASQTQSSKQSILSSQDTLTVEELDSDMDDFSQMSHDKLPHLPNRVMNLSDKDTILNPAEKNTLLPLRKHKQAQEDKTLNRPAETNSGKIQSENSKQSKPKSKKTNKAKRKLKHKDKFENVKELSKESLTETKDNTNVVVLEEHKKQSDDYNVPEPSQTHNTEQFKQSTEKDVKTTLKSKQEKQEVNELKLKKVGNISAENSEKVQRVTEPVDKQVNGRSDVVCEAVETATGITIAYRGTQVNNKRLIEDTNQIARGDSIPEPRCTSPLPKDLYQKELEKVRLNRKRKRQYQRRNPDLTPRVPKPTDREAMGYLGSNVIFRDKPRPTSGSGLKTLDLSSTENLSEQGTESLLSGNSDLSSLNKSNELIVDNVVFSDRSIEKDVDLFSLDSVEETNAKFFSEKNSLIIGDIPLRSDSHSGSSTSDVFTKQKLLYSRFERRPYSETVLRLAGRPPLPPETTNTVARPVSEKVRRAQAYSRYFTPDVDLY